MTAEVKFYWENPVEVESIANSWEAAFYRKFNFTEWRWRFEQLADTKDVLASYIIDGTAITCFVALFTMHVNTPDEAALKSGLMQMGFTHPSYQGRGLFTQISKEFNSRLVTFGFDFIFAFANNNSHYTNRRSLNWQDIGILTDFTLNTDHIKLLKIPRNLVAEDRVLDSGIMDQLAVMPVCKKMYHFIRSRQFLNWRLLQHPTNTYRAVCLHENEELKAVAIYKVYEGKQIDIMEIFWSHEKLIYSEDVYHALVNFFTAKSYSMINIWSNLFSLEHLHLEKLGFSESRFSAYFGIIKLNERAISTRMEDWHYRFLDSDVY